MEDEESQSKMKKTDPTTGKMIQGALELTHTDIEFEPLFTKCRFCEDETCEPEIEDEEWVDYDESSSSNGGYGLLREKSFMVCTKGFGLLYISDDGQRPCDAKALAAASLILEGNRELLGKFRCAAFGGGPGQYGYRKLYFVANRFGDQWARPVNVSPFLQRHG